MEARAATTAEVERTVGMAVAVANTEARVAAKGWEKGTGRMTTGIVCMRLKSCIYCDPSQLWKNLHSISDPLRPRRVAVRVAGVAVKQAAAVEVQAAVTEAAVEMADGGA